MIYRLTHEDIMAATEFIMVVASSIGSKEWKDHYESMTKKVTKGTVLVARCEYYGSRTYKYVKVKSFYDFYGLVGKQNDSEHPLYEVTLEVMTKRDFKAKTR